MARLLVIAAAGLAIAATSPVICATATPASAQEWRDSDPDMHGDLDRDMRDLLRDRIQTRRDLRDFVRDLIDRRLEQRAALRERMREWRDRDDGDDDERRGHLREGIAERSHGDDDGECYFVTRSLRDEDGDLFVLVRRRVCR